MPGSIMFWGFFLCFLMVCYSNSAKFFESYFYVRLWYFLVNCVVLEKSIVCSVFYKCQVGQVSVVHVF
jgi:hypothetical protein